MFCADRTYRSEQVPILHGVGNDDPHVTIAKQGIVAGVSDWLGGLDAERVDATVDQETNNLHAPAGQVCPACGRPIRVGEPVRRQVSGAYKHDTC